MAMRNVFFSKGMTNKSVLYYEEELWTLNLEAMRKPNAFDIWSYTRILRIFWINLATNAEVLRMVGELTIKERKLQYLGHIMSRDTYGIFGVMV